jgi:hypothetical protein
LKAASASTGLPLSDEDKTTKEEDGWKLLNTLRHYNVRDGVTLILVTKQRTGDGDEASRINDDDDDEGIVRKVHGLYYQAVPHVKQQYSSYRLGVQFFWSFLLPNLLFLRKLWLAKGCMIASVFWPKSINFVAAYKRQFDRVIPPVK